MWTAGIGTQALLNFISCKTLIGLCSYSVTRIMQCVGRKQLEYLGISLLYSHGKASECYQRGADAKKGASPTPSSHRGEAGDRGNPVHNLREDVVSLEEGLSQMGALSKMPFRYPQSS